MITKINTTKLITFTKFVKIIIGLPYEGSTAISADVSMKRISAEEGSNIANIRASFHSRIVARAINTNVAIPDITTKTIGAVGTPSRFSADAKTDKM